MMSSAQLLALLASDPFNEVRAALARNRGTPPAILAQLSNDSSFDAIRESRRA